VFPGPSRLRAAAIHSLGWCGTVRVAEGTTVVCVQPQEPTPGAPPPPPVAPPTPAVPPGRKPANRRTRLILAMVGGVMALLCLGVVGVVVSLYDQATEIKRSEPDAVVDNFLRAYLVNRDDQRASLYQCKSGGDFGQIESYRADIVTREKQFSVGIRVSWTTFTVQTDGADGNVTTDLIKTTTDQSGRLRNTWRFAVVDEDGWRVCGAAPES
jgi:hypothetical protein